MTTNLFQQRNRRAAVTAALAFTCLVPLAAVAATVGEKAPDFTLPDTDGKAHTLSELLDGKKIVVLEWFNPDCPFILKHHQQNHTMIDLAARYRDRGVVWLAINSAAAGKQGADLERNRKAREEYQMPFPVLMDADGAVGKSYGAKTTPHMFVIAADGTLAYAGAIDDDRSPSTLGKTNYVADAVDALLAGKPVPVKETPSYGCGVKYGS
jgi:peroxiredoxin